MLFSAEITDFRTIHNVLRSLSLKDYVIVRPTEDGLKFTLEELKSVEISTYIPRTMFLNYDLPQNEEIIFRISMKVLTECLNIFGDEGNPVIKLSYCNQGDPLVLIIKHSEENITVDCEIRTMNVEDPSDISLADECGLNKIVINANLLTELLHRLDNAADELQVSVNSDPPHFVLSTKGIAGESRVNIPKNSEAVTIFQCQKDCTYKYSFADIRHVLKAMNYADKVGVFMGETGLLGLQLVINTNEKQMYVEYYVMSLFNNE